MPHLGSLIENACKSAGLKLKHLCDDAGIPYGTLHQQISRQSKIPFETIDAIAHALQLPLEHFSQNPQRIRTRQALANEIVQLLGQEPQKPKSPSVEECWARLNECDFQLDRLGSFQSHCDIYHQLSPEDAMPHPINFGSDSLSRSFLGLDSKTSYYNKLRSFNTDLKQRAFSAHQDVRNRQFSVTTETISETIEGQAVQGCYLRATARVQNRSKQDRTLIFTQFLIDFRGENKLDLPTG